MAAPDRHHQLKQFHQLLNTADGRAMMAELKLAWHDQTPLDSCPATCGFNIGMSECFKQLEVWQEGKGLDAGERIDLSIMREATHG